MKTIYNTYVEMESQEQCDRMKQLCIDNGLNKKFLESDFDFCETYKYFLHAFNGFFIASNYFKREKTTEQEFIKLLKNEKENN